MYPKTRAYIPHSDTDTHTTQFMNERTTWIQRDRRLQEHGRDGQQRGAGARRPAGAAAEAARAAAAGGVSPAGDFFSSTYK